MPKMEEPTKMARSGEIQKQGGREGSERSCRVKAISFHSLK